MPGATAASSTVIYRTRSIVTMNEANPHATHVAVRDGRILGVGPLDELTGWGDYTLDTTFADHVLVPGFVEAHGHIQDGASWAMPYLGFFDRADPDGKIHPGQKSVEQAIATLKALDAAMPDPATPLVVWGFDPIYYPGPRLTAADLDAVSTTRQIYVGHASGHVATVNTALLTACNITAATDTPGVEKDASGNPIGELQEQAAMMLATPGFQAMAKAALDPDSFRRYAAIGRNAGHTTLTDLVSLSFITQKYADVAAAVSAEAGFPARLVQYGMPKPGGIEAITDAITQYRALKPTETEKNRFGGVKLVYDGSIQGFTANLMWPGYYTGEDDGLWTLDVAAFPGMVRALHEAGINIHIHCNGNETVQATIEAIEEALKSCAWLNHRHTIQHSQLTTPAQYRRMALNNICANIFTNHLWYWGDQHYELTVGPDRANQMDNCAEALRAGVKFSMHSDSGVTPTGHLHTMWCAVNRVTVKGRVLGEVNRISAYDALKAATIDAAWQIHLDHEIGSIEVGKKADFAVLEQSPLEVDPMAIKDIPVWGTVLAGEKHEAAKG
jgi:predicted amidohydrolase YtcJ